jgi:hypothetical protein
MRPNQGQMGSNHAALTQAKEGTGSDLRACVSLGASLFSECLLFFPPAPVERKSERSAFRLSQFVSKMHRYVSGKEKGVAVYRGFRFILRMIRALIPVSKLCVVRPHPAIDDEPTARRMASTWQGRETLPLHPSPCAAWSRQVEPVAGSTPPSVGV